MIRVIFLGLLLIASVAAYSQDVLEKKIGTVKNGQPFIEFLSEIESSGDIKFFYLTEWLEPYSTFSELSGLTLREALLSVLKDSDLNFVFAYDYAVVFFKDPTKEIERNALFRAAKANNVQVSKVVIGKEQDFVPGKKVTLRGTVSNSENKSPLTGATIFISGLNFAISTNVQGEYTIVIPSGEYSVSYRYINFQEELVDLAIYSEGRIDIDLEENPRMLNEVVVSSQHAPTTRGGVSSIKMNDLKRTPAFLGVPDLIKQIQLETGVTTVSEASAGFNVRGGGADQNLIVYDGVPVFNTAHALGFFSAFNSDAINEASFYKGAIPAEYGGRVSSVLNVGSKEGSYQKWNGIANLGIISSGLAIGGPIKKDTSSLMLSFRSSYSDWILNLVKTRYDNIADGSVFFYDASFKYSDKISKDSKLVFSGYMSKDKFRLANDTLSEWRNTTFSARYFKTLSPTLYYNVGLYMGQYTYRVSSNKEGTGFTLDYSMLYPSLKIDLNHEGPVHKKSFGLHTTYYRFNPGKLKPNSGESSVVNTTMPIEQAIETALYFGDSFNWGSQFNLELGLRLSFYTRFGPGTVYTYESGQPREPRNVMDSVAYESGEIMKTYVGPEPRVSLSYSLSENSSVKLGYNRMYQYVHLISNSAAISPVDIWQISNVYFKPQIGDQLSLGYFKNFKNKSIDTSVELYYKYLQNILDFKDGANLILNPQLETSLLSGVSNSYGVEFSINKRTGRLTGNVNYTFSRSLRQVDGNFDLEKVNDGEVYPSNFDQPHIANINLRFGATRKIFFSGNFTYHTGRPVSLPIGGYMIDNNPISNFSERNNYRIPDYHRLDLALVIEGGNRKKKRVENQWTISVYNVYGRKNPYSVFYSDPGSGVLQPYQLSLIGTAVPSISYSCKF